ncbi:MAG: hypothetical protein NC548_48005 [Lachnospiraceae bacterium]|nr:hypothetical protein [Lachnospiraceae bacterium]
MIVNANIILAKCSSDNELYGMRVEERNGDWFRTWAFKIKEEMARREGFDRAVLSGNFYADEDYPGCPYCGGSDFTVCGACKKITCYRGGETNTCRWCGKVLRVVEADKLDVTGGDF